MNETDKSVLLLDVNSLFNPRKTRKSDESLDDTAGIFW